LYYPAACSAICVVCSNPIIHATDYNESLSDRGRRQYFAGRLCLPPQFSVGVKSQQHALLARNRDDCAIAADTWRPLMALIRLIDPFAAATNRLSLAKAGVKAKAPAAPTEADHAVRTGIVGLKSTSAAGGLRGSDFLANGFNDEHPANTAINPTHVSFTAVCICSPLADSRA
jgi:hypothetical protein